MLPLQRRPGRRSGAFCGPRPRQCRRPPPRAENSRPARARSLRRPVSEDRLRSDVARARVAAVAAAIFLRPLARRARPKSGVAPRAARRNGGLGKAPREGGVCRATGPSVGFVPILTVSLGTTLWSATPPVSSGDDPLVFIHTLCRDPRDDRPKPRSSGSVGRTGGRSETGRALGRARLSSNSRSKHVLGMTIWSAPHEPRDDRPDPGYSGSAGRSGGRSETGRALGWAGTIVQFPPVACSPPF